MDNVAYKVAIEQQQNGHKEAKVDWIENRRNTVNSTRLGRPSPHYPIDSTAHTPRSNSSLHAPYSNQDRWDEAETSLASLSSPESPSPRSLAVSLSRGEAVVVRCSQQKWLRGEVTRLSNKGVRVMVEELGLLVNVPLELLHTHIQKFSALDGISTLPQGQNMLSFATEDPSHEGRLLVHCVRPAHLSHRKLCLILDRDICCVCREKIISEDEGVELWDCHHGCHLGCFKSRPGLVSIMNCPLCAEESVPSQLLSSNYLPSNDALINPNASSGKLIPIDEEDPDLNSSSFEQETIPASAEIYRLSTAPKELRGSGKVALGSAAQEEPSSSPAASGQVPSPMERMKFVALPGINQQRDLPQSHDHKKDDMNTVFPGKDASSQGAWISVIKDGQDTRQDARQQKLECMAKKKEKLMSNLKSGK